MVFNAASACGILRCKQKVREFDATDTRDQSGTNAEGTRGLLKGLEELLQLLSDALDTAKPRLLDTPQVAIDDLEAMEEWSRAVPGASTTGG